MQRKKPKYDPRAVRVQVKSADNIERSRTRTYYRTSVKAVVARIDRMADDAAVRAIIKGARI